MAAKKKTKKAAKKAAPARKSHATRRRAVEKSLREVKAAQRNLELKVKQHHLVVSSMFFPDDTPVGG